MKIRMGFVSNSSSSNFILYGNYFEIDYRNEISSCTSFLKSVGLDPSKLKTTCEDGDIVEGWELRERISNMLQEKGFDVQQNEGGLYYGVILEDYEVDGSTDAVCKKLKSAKIKAKKLGIKDKLQLVYTSS